MKFLFSLFFCFIFTFYFSQENYNTAIGIKGGYPSFGSLNIKHRLKKKDNSSLFHPSIEASIGGSAIGVSSSGIIVEGAYELNSPLKEDGLEWYYGGGIVIGIVKEADINTEFGMKNSLLTGLKGVIGIEYTFEDFPLNIALDTGPLILFTPNISFTWTGGLAIRYCLFNK